jgi:hypothetical protein
MRFFGGRNKQPTKYRFRVTVGLEKVPPTVQHVIIAWRRKAQRGMSAVLAVRDGAVRPLQPFEMNATMLMDTKKHTAEKKILKVEVFEAQCEDGARKPNGWSAKVEIDLSGGVGQFESNLFTTTAKLEPKVSSKGPTGYCVAVFNIEGRPGGASFAVRERLRVESVHAWC